MTLAEMLEQVSRGTMTADEAAQAVRHPASYALEFTEPAPGTEKAFWAIRDAYVALKASAETAIPRAIPAETIRCDCGHRAPRHEIMSASLGSSCQDCYDRMN